MTSEKPAQGIMLNADYVDAKTYTIACDCTDPDHSIHMWIEAEGDNETKDITLTFYVNTTTPFWKKGFSRIKSAWDILIHGYREDQHSLILKKQSALNLAETIKSIVNDLEKL